MAFSASEIAFEGFRLTRERPAAIGLWAVAHLIISVISGVALTSLMGADLALIQNFKPDQSGDLESINAMLPALGKLYALVIPLALFTGALFTCAALRAVLRPQDSRFGYLRFGVDEFRMILLYIVMVLIYAAVLALAVIGVTLVAMGLGMLVGGGAAAGLLAGLLTFCVLIGGAIWLAVRLSLAPALTFTTGSIQLREAWRLTKGRFWQLLGAYFISWVLAVVVSLLGMAIIFAVIAGIGGGFSALGPVMNPDVSTIAAQFTPTAIAVQILSAVLAALQTAILRTPPALAYREIAAAPTVDTFA